MPLAAYVALLDALADAVIVSDRGNRVVFLNRAAERLLDWPREELQGRPLTTIMPERMRAAHEAGFHRFITTHESHIMGTPVRVPAMRRDGKEIDVELTLSMLMLSGYEMYLASLRDLSVRVELERQLRASRLIRAQYSVMSIAAGALSLEEAGPKILATIGEQLELQAGELWVVDAKDELMRCAATWTEDRAGLRSFVESSSQLAFERGHGLPGRVWASGHAVWVSDLSREDNYPRAQPALAAGLSSAFAFPITTGATIGVLEFYSCSQQPPDQELLTTMATLGGQIGQMLERLRINAELLEAVRARDEFISVAGHELRTPLTAMQLSVQSLLRLLRKTGDAPPPREQLKAKLDAIAGHVKRQAKLIENLLDVTRISAGRLQLTIEHVDASEIARGVVTSLSETAAASGSTITLDAPAPVTGDWDPVRLDQVITNLLSNAIRYGDQQPIDVTVRGDGELARIAVRDRGPGISPEEQQKIFTRFVRLVADSHIAGFGLGLWISRQIAGAMGGRISIENAAGGGSTFTVELPTRGLPQ